MKVENARTLPQIFYGLHMVEGVAEYAEPEENRGKPYRIFVGEETIKNMNKTYAGKPLYVYHVDDVDLKNLQQEADGYVIESFYNKQDGKHWAKFIVVSDKGHEAIRSGWRLSNAYVPIQFGPGGKWHGVDYLKEVIQGEYEHLALVPNPRYDESIVLTPEEFKSYNEQKETDLKKVANSLTQGAKAMFSFFKKTKVDNSADFECMTVLLPKSGKEIVLAQIINEMDEQHSKKQEDESEKMAHPDHHVMVGKEKMKINDLIKKYMDMCDASSEKKNEEHKEEKAEAEPMKHSESAEKAQKPEGSEEAKENVDIYYHPAKKTKKHDDSEAEQKEEPEAAKKDSEETKEKALESASEEDDKEALKRALELAEHEVEEMQEPKKKKNSSAHFDALKNAETNVRRLNGNIELSEDRVARGKARYGSN